MTEKTLKIVGICIALAAASTLSFIAWLPDVDALRVENPKTTKYVQIYVRRISKDGERPATAMRWVKLEEMSPYVIHAVRIAEDARFFRHQGVDWDAMRQAMRYNWRKRAWRRGASTITQQVARNLFLSPSRSFARKLKEILIARHLERSLSKQRILEIYLNIVEWGEGIFGAEAASQAYFGKPARELNMEEAVALAATLPSPYVRHPRNEPTEHLTAVRKVLLERLQRVFPDRSVNKPYRASRK